MNKYFYDLHIHSCLSPCADDDMTPNNIAGMAALNGLQIAALTDHNSCENCPPFLEACKRLGIIGIAGMELTTAEDIHIVCLFEELENAMAFSREIYGHILPIDNRPEIFGNQIVTDAADEPIKTEPRLLISATDLWMADAIELAVNRITKAKFKTQLELSFFTADEYYEKLEASFAAREEAEAAGLIKAPVADEESTEEETFENEWGVA